MNKPPRETRVIKPNRLLQSKVGTGTIDEKKIKRSQKIIDQNTEDFTPMGLEILAALEETVKQARENPDTDPAQHIEAMAEPVMQMKGSAAMFGYKLISALTGTMLNLLESVDTIDKDLLDIVDAHRKTLAVLIKNQMKGDGGEYGSELQKELKDACKRYFAKKASTPAASGEDVFFIDG